MDASPYVMFAYSIRSPYTKETYFRRLRRFFDAVSIDGITFEDRCNQFAEKGDIFIGAIWGSVEKWCMIEDGRNNYVVTNGCHRFRFKKGKENFLIDVVTYLSTDSFATQMRALTRGSDGLAEISVDDVLQVLIPRITNEATRRLLEPFIDNLMIGRQSLYALVSSLLDKGQLNIPMPTRRPNHTVLV